MLFTKRGSIKELRDLVIKKMDKGLTGEEVAKILYEGAHCLSHLSSISTKNVKTLQKRGF